MTALGSASAALLAPVVPAFGHGPGSEIGYPDLAAAIAWSLCGALLAALGALALQVERAPKPRRLRTVRSAGLPSVPVHRRVAEPAAGTVVSPLDQPPAPLLFVSRRRP